MKTKEKRRPKGEGSITELPNGRFKMTISIGIDPEGKQRRKSVTAKTKAELLRRVAQLRLEVGQSDPKSSPLFFKYLTEVFLAEKENTVSPNTYDYYVRYCEKTFKPFHNYRINKITPIMVDNLLDKLDMLKPSSVRHARKGLSTFFNWCLNRGYLDKSPMRQTKKRPLGTLKVNRVIIPSDQEIQVMLQDAKEYDSKHPTKTQLYPLFLLALSTGMRLGELLGVTSKDIDLTKNIIDVNKQKSKWGMNCVLKTPTSYRRIFVQPEILREVLKATNGKLWEGQGYRQSQAYVSKFMAMCPHKPKGFTFHCFRHYHATKLLMNGIDIKEVSKRLGHSSIKTTLDLYAHWMPEMDEKAANSISTSFIL